MAKTQAQALQSNLVGQYACPQNGAAHCFGEVLGSAWISAAFLDKDNNLRVLIQDKFGHTHETSPENIRIFANQCDAATYRLALENGLRRLYDLEQKRHTLTTGCKEFKETIQAIERAEAYLRAL